MTQENGEVLVRDLGSTNGIRINGQRVEIGRLKAGDELSIAHIRYRLENGQAHEQTIAEPAGAVLGRSEAVERGASALARPLEPASPASFENQGENAFAAAVRKLLPSGVADKCRIQVIVQMAGEEAANQQPASPNPNLGSEDEAECRSD
jgi:pSer/pThr/pTyr-binding forkhead associated (FHA) protein